MKMKSTGLSSVEKNFVWASDHLQLLARKDFANSNAQGKYGAATFEIQKKEFEARGHRGLCLNSSPRHSNCS
jgi:hypothetical protein